MTNPDVKNLLNELSNLRKDISTLRVQLNELNDKKEGFFDEKEKVSKNIVQLISQIKDLKRERDDFTQKVRTLKVERTGYNTQLNQSAGELKKLLGDKAEIKKVQHIKGNPVMIRKKIEELEFRIETEGMSFEKEKKIMTEINDLKKQLDESKDFIDASEKIRGAKDTFHDLKKKANTTHRTIQDHAKNSQERHEKILEISKQIDELRNTEKDAFAKFLAAKEEFNKVNDALKEKLVATNRISEQLKEHNIEVKKEHKEKEQKTLMEKGKEVDEKIKTGKKLTTEDLLIYQKTFAEEENKDDEQEQ